ncbi:MAG: hypothetical protein D6698_10115, partial [Gammaproteobacteria bacterium]
MPRAVRVTGFAPVTARFETPLNTLTSAAPERVPNLGQNPWMSILSDIAGTAQTLAVNKIRRDYLDEQQKAEISAAQYQEAQAEILELHRKAATDPSVYSVLDERLEAFTNDPSLTPEDQNRFRNQRVALARQIQAAKEQQAEIARDAAVTQINRAIANLEPLYESDEALNEALSSLDPAERLAFLDNLITEDLKKSLDDDTFDAIMKDPEAHLLIQKSRNKIYRHIQSRIESEMAQIRARDIKDSLHTLSLDVVGGRLGWSEAVIKMRDRDPSLTVEQASNMIIKSYKEHLMDVMASDLPIEQKSLELRRLIDLQKNMPLELAEETSSAIAEAARVGAHQGASTVSKALLEGGNASLVGYYTPDKSGVSPADKIWADVARGFGLEIPDNVVFSALVPGDGPEGEYLKVLQSAYSRQKREAAALKVEEEEKDTENKALIQVLNGTITDPKMTREAFRASPIFRLSELDPEDMLPEMLPFISLMQADEEAEQFIAYLQKAAAEGVDPNDPDYPAETLGRLQVNIFKQAPGGPEQLTSFLSTMLETQTEWASRVIIGFMSATGGPESINFEAILSSDKITNADKYALKMLAMEEQGHIAIPPGLSTLERLQRHRHEFDSFNEFLTLPGYVARVDDPTYRNKIKEVFKIPGSVKNMVIDNDTAYWLNVAIAQVLSMDNTLSKSKQVKKAKEFLNSMGYHIVTVPGGRITHYYDPYRMLPWSYS